MGSHTVCSCQCIKRAAISVYAGVGEQCFLDAVFTVSLVRQAGRINIYIGNLMRYNSVTGSTLLSAQVGNEQRRYNRASWQLPFGLYSANQRMFQAVCWSCFISVVTAAG
jgi:hypothetical protein